MVLFGLFYLSMTLWAYASMQYAVEEAARCSGVNTTVCASAATTKSYAAGSYYGPGSPVFTYAVQTCGNAVTASLTISWNIPMFNLSIPLTAAACFP